MHGDHSRVLDSYSLRIGLSQVAKIEQHHRHDPSCHGRITVIRKRSSDDLGKYDES